MPNEGGNLISGGKINDLGAINDRGIDAVLMRRLFCVRVKIIALPGNQDGQSWTEISQLGTNSAQDTQ